MSRKTRAQRSRSRPQSQTTPQQQTTRAARKADVEAEDPMAFYRSLAAPSLGMRLVLVAGLLFYIAAQLVALSSSKQLDVASDLALAGMVGILLFLGGGFVRHQRALFRIRRENPGAWQPTMRFAMSSLPIPLGFGGRPADSRERAIRWLTLVLLLVFALTAIAGSAKR